MYLSIRSVLEILLCALSSTLLSTFHLHNHPVRYYIISVFQTRKASLWDGKNPLLKLTLFSTAGLGRDQSGSKTLTINCARWAVFRWKEGPESNKKQQKISGRNCLALKLSPVELSATIKMLYTFAVQYGSQVWLVQQMNYILNLISF